MTIFPTPSPEGLLKLQEYYHTQHNMEISKEQAYEILSGVMRFLYLTQIKQMEPEHVEQSQPTPPM